jgi:CRISPR-associated protein Cmr2
MEQAPLDAPECVLYASGGNLLALVPAGQGATFAAAIEQRYTRETFTAASVAVSITVDLLALQYGRAPDACWQEDIQAMAAADEQVARLLRQSLGAADGLPAAFARHKGFGELVTHLANLANQRRASDGRATGSPRYATLIELTSFSRKCTSCDERPAVEEIADERQQFFCEPCARKRHAGSWAKQSNRPDLYYNQDIPRLEWVRPWDTWLTSSAAALGLPHTIEQTTRDLQELGAAAGGAARGYVGLIYADGNNVANAVATLSTVSAYRTFAREMLLANERAVAHALLDTLRPTREGVWPFEVITIGGDDVLLFVPADRALHLAHRIAEDFTAAMQERAITLSVGVLLMPDHTPVRFAVDLAEQLLKSAKRRSKTDPATLKPPTLDFMALREVTLVAETIKDYRTVALQRQDEPISLTQRPYRLDELATLLNACRALQQASFPRSQLYQLRQIISQGHILQSVIDYHYYVGRGQRRGGSTAYTHLAEQFTALCGEHAWLPWRITTETAQADRPRQTRYDTPLLDLIEIYPFVPTDDVLASDVPYGVAAHG